MKPIFIDVREYDEFEAEHIEGSINIPLSRFSSIAPNFLAMTIGQTVFVLCQSGHRAQKAIEMAKEMRLPQLDNLVCYQGGIRQWKKLGHSTRYFTGTASRIALSNQVQLVMGCLVVLFSTLGYVINPIYSVLAAVIGLGLVLANTTNYCLLTSVLSRLPWNRHRRSRLRC